MKRHHNRSTPAFTLVEVTLALGVAGFCLIAIFGLLPVALNSNQASIQQTAANGIISAVISDLRATPPATPRGAAAASQQYSIPIPAAGSTGSVTLYFNDARQMVSSAVGNPYRVTIKFLSTPAGGGTRSASCMDLKVSWPAPVDPAKTRPIGMVETVVALDRN